MAVEGALRCSVCIARLLSFLGVFERFLGKHEMYDELSQFRDQYGYFWSKTDEWKLEPDANDAERLCMTG